MINFAKRELDRIPKDKEGMQEYMNKQILEMVELFSSYGHSGSSAPYSIAILDRLLSFKPLTPLTGEDDEWMEIDNETEQSKRCSGVFRKNKDNNTAYYIDGKVFSDDGGMTWWTTSDSHIKIEFPFEVPDGPERVLISGAIED